MLTLIGHCRSRRPDRKRIALRRRRPSAVGQSATWTAAWRLAVDGRQMFRHVGDALHQGIHLRDFPGELRPYRRLEITTSATSITNAPAPPITQSW